MPGDGGGDRVGTPPQAAVGQTVDREDYEDRRHAEGSAGRRRVRPSRRRQSAHSVSNSAFSFCDDFAMGSDLDFCVGPCKNQDLTPPEAAYGSGAPVPDEPTNSVRTYGGVKRLLFDL